MMRLRGVKKLFAYPPATTYLLPWIACDIQPSEFA
ncbi:MAG: hypothetical protein QOJ88_1501 [Pyrinomonadaceae bacterium]|jgi:hypothetical protein|nr:hypothetical protein [Pyrinomonadaceae bacterium]MDQ1729021.1 hypothetical protein [Pyrinomonadaceae bacterium]